jgi:16S rRNA (guanine527-N7)-methyltransferase
MDGLPAEGFFENQLPFLKREADRMGIRLSDRALSLCRLYAQRLVEANRSVNLTAITEPEQIALKHFLDSLSPLSHGLIAPDARLADVGCGAGLPGLPLKFALPGLRLTLMDSLQKRIRFIDAFLFEAGLDNAVTAAVRAEDAGRTPEFRERFDVVVSRAVAELRALCEYCLPLVRVGGRMVAYKGPNAPEEADKARRAVKELGGDGVRIIPSGLGRGLERYLVVVEKTSPTPSVYPRKQAKIAKAPL